MAGVTAPGSVTLTLEDDEKGGLVFSAAGELTANLTVREGASTSLTLRLSAPPPNPADPVVVFFRASAHTNLVAFTPPYVTFQQGTEGGTSGMATTHTTPSLPPSQLMMVL